MNDKTRFLHALRTFSVFNQRNLTSKCFRQIQRNMLQYLPLRRKKNSEIFQNIALKLKKIFYVLEKKKERQQNTIKLCFPNIRNCTIFI